MIVKNGKANYLHGFVELTGVLSCELVLSSFFGVYLRFCVSFRPRPAPFSGRLFAQFWQWFFDSKIKILRVRFALRVNVTTQAQQFIIIRAPKTNRKSGLDFLKYFHLLLVFAKIKRFRVWAERFEQKKTQTNKKSEFETFLFSRSRNNIFHEVF